jgi:hypothetical protein
LEEGITYHGSAGRVKGFLDGHGAFIFFLAELRTAGYSVQVFALIRESFLGCGVLEE